MALRLRQKPLDGLDFMQTLADAGGASIILPRLDGMVSTSGAELNMSSTSIVTGFIITIDTSTCYVPVV